MIFELAGRPPLDKSSLAGPAYTLSVEGTAVIFALGVRVDGHEGVDQNTMEHLLGTDSRNPPAKHRILEMYVEHGFEPPDTPVMALHRGRIDLLETHLKRDPNLLTRTFDIAEIYPLAPACSRDPYTAQGTPVHADLREPRVASSDRRAWWWSIAIEWKQRSCPRLKPDISAMAYLIHQRCSRQRQWREMR